MFRPATAAGRTAGGEFFFSPAPVMIQREEATKPPASAPTEAPDPIVEGLKTTGEELLKLPAFKIWYEPKLDTLKKQLWEEQPSDTKAALISFVAIDVALAGLVFALNPEIRQMLSDTNVGAPLGLIPYSPVEGFKYTLPSPGKPGYSFGADFTLNPYLKDKAGPLTGATFGLDSSYNPSTGGFSITGGKFGLDFYDGGLSVEGKSFTSLSPYPQLIPSQTPGGPSSMLMQSVPGQPPLQTGPGFQVMVSADLLKLFPKLKAAF